MMEWNPGMYGATVASIESMSALPISAMTNVAQSSSELNGESERNFASPDAYVFRELGKVADLDN